MQMKGVEFSLVKHFYTRLYAFSLLSVWKKNNQELEVKTSSIKTMLLCRGKLQVSFVKQGFLAGLNLHEESVLNIWQTIKNHQDVLFLHFTVKCSQKNWIKLELRTKNYKERAFSSFLAFCLQDFSFPQYEN